MIVLCACCQRQRPSVMRSITICQPCNAALTAGLAYCNRCQTAKAVNVMYRPWRCLACHSDHQLAYRAADPARQAQARRSAAAWKAAHRELARANSRQYYRANKAKWYRPERRAWENAYRRRRYATDPTFRAKRKAISRAYASIRQYKIRMLRKEQPR